MKLIDSFVNQRAKELFSKIVEYRRYLHQNPEVSFKEFNTCRFICETLDKLSVKYNKCTETGVVAVIGSGEPCVALRADIDALLIKEETELEFKSQNEGIMHACGHDFHTAMLLGATEIIKEKESELKGTVKIIFQPGEEMLPGGAKLMIENSVLENPKPVAIFGQHIDPNNKCGKVFLSQGPVMASSDELYWTIKGHGSHAAQPHLGKDPIIAAASLIMNLQSIITKFRNPFDTAVLSVTSIHSGSATNIIPEVAELKGTFRTYDENLRESSLQSIKNMTDALCSSYNTMCNQKTLRGYPALVNNSYTTSFVKTVAQDILGGNNVEDFKPKMWAEDFAYFAQKIPGTFWFIGAKNEDNGDHGLHSPLLSPNENALLTGTIMLAAVALNFVVPDTESK